MQVPIVLNRRARSPLHRQIYDQWRDGILSGRFGPGERIPSTRELADLLHVSRSTVTTAYDQLTAEGYLQAERGSGSFVSRELPDRPLARKRSAAAVDEPPPVRLSRYGARVAAAPSAGDGVSPPGVLDLSKWSPDVEAFPIRIWRRLVMRHVRSLSTPAWESADWGAGHEPLRREIASYLRRTRAVRCEAGQVIVVNGSQQALDSVCAGARRPGRRRGRRGSVLPGRAAAVRGARRAPAPRAGAARRHRGVRAARRGARGLRHPVAPAPDRRVDVAAAAARAARMGAGPRRRGDRGRLRQRIPLQRRAAAGAAGPERRGLGDLRRHLLERDVPRPPHRLPGGAAVARRRLRQRQVACRPPHRDPRAGRARRLPARGPLRAPRPPHAPPLRPPLSGADDGAGASPRRRGHRAERRRRHVPDGALRLGPCRRAGAPARRAPDQHRALLPRAGAAARIRAALLRRRRADAARGHQAAGDPADPARD